MVDDEVILNVLGRVKNYKYNGKILKGKWELKIAQLLDENNIIWTNVIKPTPYLWNDDWHLYFPDFYLNEKDVYIEVKGYQRERDLLKWEYFDKKLIIIKKNDIKLLTDKKKSIIDYIN